MLRFARKHRLIAWSAWLALLAGVGVGLYVSLPPEPRWCLAGCDRVDFTLAEQGRFLVWQDEPGGATGAAILRDLYTGRPIHTFFMGDRGPATLVCAPDGSWVAQYGSDILRIAAVADGAERTIPQAHGTTVNRVAFAHHGEVMAVHQHCVQDGNDVHNRLVLVETATGNQLAALRGWLVHAASARDGKLLLLAIEIGEQTMLKAWDVRDRRWAFELPSPLIATRYTVGPDGRTLVSHAHRSRHQPWAVCDVESGTVVFTGPEKSGIDDLSFSADGRRLAIRHHRPTSPKVDVFDLDARSRLLHIDDTYHPQVALSPDGRRLALQAIIHPGNNPDIAVTMLDVDTGRRLWQESAEPASHFWVAPKPTFGPDGRSVVVYRHAPQRAELFDTETGERLATLPLAGPDVLWSESDVTVSPDCRTHVVYANPIPAMRPNWWPDWLRRLLGEDARYEFIVIDIEARRVLGRLQIHDGGNPPTVLCGGRLLVARLPGDGSHPSRLCCWDLPGRPPWRWVIGIPAALGAASIATLWLRQRRRASAS